MPFIKPPLTHDQKQLLRAARDAHDAVDDARDTRNLAVRAALEAGVSLRDAAKALGVSHHAISAWRDSY